MACSGLLGGHAGGWGKQDRTRNALYYRDGDSVRPRSEDDRGLAKGKRELAGCCVSVVLLCSLARCLCSCFRQSLFIRLILAASGKHGGGSPCQPSGGRVLYLSPTDNAGFRLGPET